MPRFHPAWCNSSRMRACLLVVGVVFGLAVHASEEEALADGNAERWKAFSEGVIERLKFEREQSVRVELIRSFAEEDYGESAQYLIGLLVNRNTPAVVRTVIADVLGAYQSDEARAAVKEAIGDRLEQNVYLLRAFVAHGDKEARKQLLHLAAEGKTPRAQGLAIEGLRMLREPEKLSTGYWEALIKWAEDPETFHGIRIEATKSLRDWNDYHAVATLMGLLDDPLLRDTAREGLTKLTGERHWNSAYLWKQWWEGKENNYTPEPISDEAYAELSAELIQEAKENDDMEFFGIRITGRNLLFILDNSGSMYLDDRFLQLKDELTGMISSLGESYSFGLLLFPEQSVPGRDFGEATDRYKEKAQEFVGRIQPEGETPLGEAIDHAFSRIVPREKVDTIYLLSDGRPSDTSPEFLINELAGFWEEYQVTVHTIFLGDDDVGRAVMEDIADIMRGRFIHIP